MMEIKLDMKSLPMVKHTYLSIITDIKLKLLEILMLVDMKFTLTQMLKRVESQPNIVYKPLFKLTSHAIINMNAYQFNKNQDNEEVSVNDGFDFDTVRLCCYDVVKAK